MLFIFKLLNSTYGKPQMTFKRCGTQHPLISPYLNSRPPTRRLFPLFERAQANGADLAFKPIEVACLCIDFLRCQIILLAYSKCELVGHVCIDTTIYNGCHPILAVALFPLADVSYGFSTLSFPKIDQYILIYLGSKCSRHNQRRLSPYVVPLI